MECEKADHRTTQYIADRPILHIELTGWDLP